MLHCSNGHTNPDAAAYCATCGVELATAEIPAQHTSTDAVSSASPPGGPADRISTRRPWLLAGSLAAIGLVLMGLVVAAQAGGDDQDRASSGSTAEDPAAAVDGEEPVPPTAQEECVEVVMELVAQIPDALASGYSSVSPQPLNIEFGVDSVQVDAFLAAQAQVITGIYADGDPDWQVQQAVRVVTEKCAAAK